MVWSSRLAPARRAPPKVQVTDHVRQQTFNPRRPGPKGSPLCCADRHCCIHVIGRQDQDMKTVRADLHPWTHRPIMISATSSSAPSWPPSFPCTTARPPWRAASSFLRLPPRPVVARAPPRALAPMRPGRSTRQTADAPWGARSGGQAYVQGSTQTCRSAEKTGRASVPPSSRAAGSHRRVRTLLNRTEDDPPGARGL